MSQTTKLIRKIARELRYKTLNGAVNRDIIIHRLESIESDILASLADAFPVDCHLVKTENEFLEGAIAKYGIIDATFLAPDNLLGTDSPGGITLLKELGFITDANSEDSNAVEEMFGDDPTCLAELAEGIDKSQMVIRIFLQDDRDEDTFYLKIPEGYFPRKFRVEDACVANSDFVWFHKHFYM